MAEEISRPRFIDAWLTDLRDDYRKYGIKKLIPVWIIATATVGGLISWKLGAEQLWSKHDVAVAVLSAVATINGLFLALSWGSFAKIYEIASEPKFAAYLRKHGLLETYFFYVDYIHLAQVLALASAGATLIASLFAEFPLWGKQALFGLTIATSIYAFRYALGAVHIMQDLVWYSSVFENQSDTPPPMTVHKGGRT
jgi:hypothetical protein